MGDISPKLSNFDLSSKCDETQLEGEMLRKATETKLKKYWYVLFGKELYMYKKKDNGNHKNMHNLIGVFIREEKPEEIDDTTTLYPFTLIFPNKERTYYLESQASLDEWLTGIKKVIGYTSIGDFYELRKTLGKGKFGLVKSAKHKKTGKRVAVKIISKKEMDIDDVEL